MARRIIVDDTSDRIIYSKSYDWWDVYITQYNTANWGPAYKDTVRVTEKSTFLWFAFSGTSIIVNGYNDVSKSSDWKCTVDGVPIDGKSKMPFENGLTFCQQPNLPDGPHNLTVEVTSKDSLRFWFDHIQYTPSPNAILEDRAIIYENDDQDLKYSSGWYSANGTTKTNQTGATVELEFHGTAISGFSTLPAEFFESNSMPGTYSIDGEKPKSFDQSGHFGVLTPSYNQRFFQSPALRPGDHKLTVTYHGTTAQNPLFLDTLIVENYSTAYAAAAAAKASKIKQGEIAGGVVGGVILLLLLWFCRKAIWRGICFICRPCACLCNCATNDQESVDSDTKLPPYHQQAARV
ncbi:hypothetical protein CPB83DRAFT_863775 [Crepidotus variabilis]|uniref:Uncharacterized protein n=1 Tax=Crepidotus variabilis TaxID=179855 RepID=A0A9P6E5J7_9AGAR|nr:hypothetical protein CPB83DRAFT_863775 [Crepidotus variabilis]